MGVAIIGAPQDRPTNVTMKRGTDDTMELKWIIPSALRDENNPRRMTWMDFLWVFQASKNMSSKYQEVWGGGDFVNADRLWIRGTSSETPSQTSRTQTYDRTKYHPVTLDRYLTSVTATVFIGNTVAKPAHPTDSGLKSSITYNFQLPKQPKWSDPEFNQSTGKVTSTLTAAADEKEYELYDTMYCVTRQDNFTSTYKNETVVSAWTATKEGSVTVETDRTSEASSLTESQWIKISFKAYSRGLRGNSSTVVKTFVISNPARPSITSVTVSSLTASNGLVTVRFNTNASTYRPIDTVQLQRLTNTTINTIALARESNAWEDVANAADDGTCSGLTDTVAAARPDRNKHVWYRIKAMRGNLPQYSDPVKVTTLERNATPITDDVVTIDSIVPGDDGESLRVIFGWSDDDSNGTEISWSQNADAWISTDQPTTYNVPDTWKDETSQVSGKDNSATLIVRGLSEGVQYYVKARRYHDDGSSVEYADSYCSAPGESYPIAPVTKPSSVTLKIPTYVKRGSDLEVSWTYEGVSDQTRWNLYRHDTVNNTTNKVVLASGDDAMGSAVITADKIGESAESVKMSVSITTGGDWEESPAVEVKVADPPIVIAATDSTLYSQPAQFYIGCDRSNAELLIKVYSQGMFSGTPDGSVAQVQGDTVWSGKSTPSWYENSDGMYYSIVTLPEGLDFRNTVEYTLEATVIDPETGFSSETREMSFGVQWAHTARPPASSTSITLLGDSKSVRVSPSKPENWQAGDVYDLYRVTTDTIDLIAAGQEYGTDAVDRYAPFGKNVSLRYRIATRTKDGDVSWLDYPYFLRGYQLRFDWGSGQSLELPYNITMGDAYTKHYEAHTHLDGSKSGHWNPGFDKKGNFTTKLARVDSDEQARLIRAMGSYPGPVFVRTPDGSAYQANVLVKGLDASFDDLLLDIKIDVEALSLSDAYRLTADDFITVDASDVPAEETYERSQILYWGKDVPEPNDTFALNEQPIGDAFKIELLTSYDNYAEPWTLNATHLGVTVTLGSFSQDLIQYLQTTALDPSTQYLIKAYYNISPPVSEETTEETTE